MACPSVRKKQFTKPFPEGYLDLMRSPINLFHPYRLLIMQTLLLHGSAEFRQLRCNLPEITDGNLASHLKVLERSGYIHCHKEIVDRKLRTSYEITENGRTAFLQLKNSIEKAIEYGSNV